MPKLAAERVSQFSLPASRVLRSVAKAAAQQELPY
jgi:hypothetical protein